MQHDCDTPALTLTDMIGCDPTSFYAFLILMGGVFALTLLIVGGKWLYEEFC